VNDAAKPAILSAKASSDDKAPAQIGELTLSLF
jgi:hypothetical protein